MIKNILIFLVLLMFGSLKNLFLEAFAPKAIQLLPLPLRTPDNIFGIRQLGNLAHPFVERINNLLDTYPILATKENMSLFIKSAPHFESVISSFERIYQQYPSFATPRTLAMLVLLKENAPNYAREALLSHADMQHLFPAPSELKEIQHLARLKMKTTHCSHVVLISKKQHEGAIYTSEKKQDNHKEWAAKLASFLSEEQRHDFEKYDLNINKNVKLPKRYPSSPQEDPLTAYLSKTSVNAADIADIQSIVLSTIAVAISDKATPKTLRTPQELTQCLEGYEKMGLNPWVQAYTQSYHLIADKILLLLALLSPGKRTATHEAVINELQKAALFPLKRTTFLSDTAQAQLEVVAQEFRRALCPFDLLGRNPFPKYRLATPNNAEQRQISLIPDVPETYISSEKILFEHDFNVRQYGGKDRMTFRTTISQGDQDEHSYDEYLPLEDIPGLGSVCFFAKFLADNDAKVANIGISIDHSHYEPYVFTALDSGDCFKRDAVSKALFSNSEEILNNPCTKETFAYNYFVERFQGDFYLKTSNNVSRSFHSYVQEMAKSEQVQRETFACAFNCAFFPPQALEIFIKQYLAQENPFIRVEMWDRILKNQLIKEQQALLNLFEANSKFLQFFLTSSAPEDNIFHRYQQLVIQSEYFRFYKKHDLKGLPEYQKQPTMIEDYFLDFLEKQLRSNERSLYAQFQKAFESWDTSLVSSFKGLDEIIAIDRGNALKEKVAERFNFETMASKLIISEQATSCTQSQEKCGPWLSHPKN